MPTPANPKLYQKARGHPVIPDKIQEHNCSHILSKY